MFIQWLNLILVCWAKQTTYNVHVPHHCVVCKEKETIKVQVVYDASTRAGGLSSNECPFTMPNFNQRILDIFLRFCAYPVVFTANIEKAFLTVTVSEENRDALRFL